MCQSPYLFSGLNLRAVFHPILYSQGHIAPEYPPSGYGYGYGYPKPVPTPIPTCTHTVKSGSTPVGGLVKSGRKRTKEKGRGLDKGLVQPELRLIGFNDKGVER